MTYEEARELIRAQLEEGWEDGTFCLDDRQVTDDDEVFVFAVGAREYIVDGDDSYLRVGGALPVVHKDDGRVEWMAWIGLMSARPQLRTRTNPTPTLQV